MDADETSQPSKRIAPWAIAAAVIAAAVAGGVITALIIGDDSAPEGTTTTTTTEPDPHAICVAEILDGALRLATARTDPEVVDLVQTWGQTSPEWLAIVSAGTPYNGEASLYGRDEALTMLEQRVEAECDKIVGGTTTSAPTRAAPTPPTAAPSTGSVPRPAVAEPFDVATEVLEAWQDGDTGKLRQLAGPNVADVLGAPSSDVAISGCANEDPPIGSGTPSDPLISAVCTLDSEPPIYLWLGPDAAGELRVLDASDVGGE